MSEPYEIEVLRAAACPDDETCFIAGRVAPRPGKVQTVAKIVTDPALLAAYSHKIGEGEILVEYDDAEILGL